MKSMRHTAILKIISEQAIETQDDLITKLKESGFDVTQATVSRDIKQLGLVKTSDDGGKYRYCAPRPSSGTDSKFKNILTEAVVSAENAENMIVVKTYSGMANAAATLSRRTEFSAVSPATTRYSLSQETTVTRRSLTYF